jgi:aspartokinase
MRNNPIIVQKYGGACLETSAKIRAVASSLADLHSRGHRVVAIVSAMASKPASQSLTSYNRTKSMSVIGSTKRTCRGRPTMSAPEGKTDVPRGPGHFRF